MRSLDLMPLADIPEATRNAKAHDEALISRSLGRFGFIEPMVLDERTGRLISGHGRLSELRARERAGESPPDGVAVIEGAWRAPVVRGWASRTDEEADAAAIALNRVGEAGGWRDDVLAEVLAELAGEPDGLDGLGFTTTHLDDLLAGLGDMVELPAQPTDADYAPNPMATDVPVAPREVQGIREVTLLFQVDAHREFMEVLAKLRRVWSIDAAPMVVLRALRQAADD